MKGGREMRAVLLLYLFFFTCTGMPGSFYGMIHGVTHSTSFEQAVRDGILAAGDNCSRNNFIGAYTAAR